MTVNVEKLEAELRAAGCAVKAIAGDGARVVLRDGTVAEAGGRTWHERDDEPRPEGAPAPARDQAAADAARACLAAHDPTPTADQLGRARLHRAGGPLAAVALVLVDGALAPAWARSVVQQLADGARSA